MGLIFLSHSGADTEAAKDLARHLVQAGLEVWLDVERLKPGDRWGEKIEEGLRRATALVVYVGKSGVRHWVDQEVRVALDRSTKEQDFRLIPVLGQGSIPEELPLFLKQYQHLDLRSGWSDAGRLKALIEGATGRPAEGVSLLPPGKPPFKGLQFFDVEDSVLFFGRDAEIQDLLDKLKADSFLAVVGDSGSGKSSLVRAGLIPALHRGRFHDGKGWVESWRVAIARPGEDPFGELTKALLDLNPQMPSVEKADFLDGRKEKLTRQDGLDNAIAALVPRGTRTLLVVDQFEELFTLTRGLDKDKEEEEEAKKRRLAYVDSLFFAARFETERPVHVLITLRADFYSHCWEHPELTSRMGTNQYNVRRAGAERLREVIEKPLALAGARAQPGLVGAILSDVGEEPGNLPLLEHALEQLWSKRVGSEITHDAYEKIERLSGALKNHADSVLKNLRPDERQLARMVFLSLTQLGEGAEDTRRRVKKTELIALYTGGGATERVLKILTDARLLTSSREIASPKDGPAGPTPESSKAEEMLEVSHEALIREWPELKKWVNESRDELRFERQLVESAGEWDKERDSSLLWTGTRLARANEWARKHKGSMQPVVADFVTASRKRHRAGLVQRVALFVLLGLALLVPAGFGLRYWLGIQQERREAIYLDVQTNLMWTKSDNKYDVTWEEARDYCRNLRLGGYSGWELAPIEKLEALSDPKTGTIREPFQLSTGIVWSLTRVGSDSARYFYFHDGKSYSYLMDVSSASRALCVRRSGE